MLKSDRPPNFICIGAQKCATTWLYRMFCNNPNFSMPKKKELQYFYPFFKKKSIFEYRCEFGNKISGDMTPEYIIHPSENAGLMKKLFPNIKIFVLLRNPFERSLSGYKMGLRFNQIKESVSFIEAFRANYLSIATRGLYYNQIKGYLNHFEIGKNFEIFFYDDLKKDPVKFYSNICSYIGVDAIYNDSIYKVTDHFEKNVFISKNDELEIRKYYKNSILNLEKLIGKNLNWIYN